MSLSMLNIWRFSQSISSLSAIWWKCILSRVVENWRDRYISFKVKTLKLEIKKHWIQNDYDISQIHWLLFQILIKMLLYLYLIIIWMLKILLFKASLLTVLLTGSHRMQYSDETCELNTHLTSIAPTLLMR